MKVREISDPEASHLNGANGHSNGHTTKSILRSALPRPSVVTESEAEPPAMPTDWKSVAAGRLQHLQHERAKNADLERKIETMSQYPLEPPVGPPELVNFVEDLGRVAIAFKTADELQQEAARFLLGRVLEVLKFRRDFKGASDPSLPPRIFNKPSPKGAILADLDMRLCDIAENGYEQNHEEGDQTLDPLAPIVELTAILAAIRTLQT